MRTLRELNCFALLLIWVAGSAAAQTSRDAPGMLPDILLNEVISFSLGGQSTADRERNFNLRLVAGEGVVVDLVSANPVIFRTAAAVSAPGAVSSAGTPPEAVLEISDPSGNLVKRSVLRPPLSRAGLSETAVADVNSRLTIFPAVAGPYKVHVVFAESASAPFELLVRHRAVPAPPAVIRIELGEQKEGTLQGGERVLFSFTTQAAAQPIILDMTSSVLDSFLELRGPGGEDASRLAIDDDSGGGTNARIVAVLPEPGAYTIIARALGGEGKFNLALRSYRPPLLTPRSLAVGETYSAAFTGSDQGILFGSPPASYHVYEVHGGKGQRVSVIMKSDTPEIRPTLQAVVNTIAVDENKGSGEPIAVLAQSRSESGSREAHLHLRFTNSGLVIIRAGAAANTSARGAYSIAVTDEASGRP